MSGEITTRISDDVPVTSAADAAATVGAESTLLVSGFGSVGYPKAVPAALATDDVERSLSVISGGSVGREIDVELMETGAIRRRFPYQARSESRARINDGQVAFHDRHISHLSDEVQFGRETSPDVAIVEAVAVGADWLIPTMSIGHTPGFVESADRLIAEVNESQPLSLQQFHDVYRPDAPPNREPIPLSAADDRIGDARVRFDPDKLDAVVRTERAGEPYSFRDITDVDDQIASNLASFVSREIERNAVFADAVHMQFGVGSLGNALMQRLADVDFGDRSVVYFGEVIQDGLLDMLDDGTLAHASATSLALSAEGSDRLLADVDAYAEDVTLRPADVSNNPALIRRFGLISVNSAVELDLYGNVNSTHVNGTDVLNGIGGSGDFNRNALLSVTALPSTAAGGDISRIVPMTPHVDHTEHDVSVVVTEQGVADLRGLSPRERASELVEQCAHPSFVDELDDYRDAAGAQGGHIPHDLDSALSWHEGWRH
jgi:succinyl-CoA:acetate CoA-transferase